MNIKSKITEWQRAHLNLMCATPEQVFESEKELELVLFAIDTWTDMVTKIGSGGCSEADFGTVGLSVNGGTMSNEGES